MLEDQEFFNGYKLAMQYLWHCFLGDRIRSFSFLKKILELKDWESFDKLYSKIEDAIIVPMEESAGLHYDVDEIFIIRKRVKASCLEPMTNTLLFLPSQKSIEEIMDEAFMWYPIQNVNVVNKALTLVSLLLGYSRFKKDEINVIKFIHPQGFENSYSFAILIESYGLISDYSYWFLFPKLAADSGGSRRAYDFVQKHLASLKNKIRLQEVEVDKEKLLEYAKDTSIRYLERKLTDLKHINDTLRGQLLEFLISYIVAKMEYEVYWRYKNPKLLPKKEIDILAFKMKGKKIRILVIETKTSLPREVDKLIEKMEEKITIIRQYYKEVLKELAAIKNMDELQPKVLGWIITTDRVRKKKLTNNITVKDIRDLKKLCEFCKVKFSDTWLSSTPLDERQHYPYLFYQI
jgi:hypothetical protein